MGQKEAVDLRGEENKTSWKTKSIKTKGQLEETKGEENKGKTFVIFAP